MNTFEGQFGPNTYDQDSAELTPNLQHVAALEQPVPFGTIVNETGQYFILPSPV